MLRAGLSPAAPGTGGAQQSAGSHFAAQFTQAGTLSNVRVSPLHQPALQPVAPDPAAPRHETDHAPEAMALFRDGTWQLVRVDAWQHRPDGHWLCQLRWGVWGEWHTGWFDHAPDRLIAVSLPTGGRPPAGT